MKEKDSLLIESVETALMDGVKDIPSSHKIQYENCNVTTVKIETQKESEALGREKGTYITVEFDKIYKIDDDAFEAVVDVVSNVLKEFTDGHQKKRILVVGIGNREITADSIGPKTIDRIIVTRGLENTGFIDEGCFGNISALCTDVFGKTGIESAEMIEGVSKIICPSLIIVVDSLATTKLERLCKTVQISDTSISPGGGVENQRKKIASDMLGIPLVSIGVPTVINTSLLIDEPNKLEDFDDTLITVPSQIGTATDLGAKLIAFSINKAIHYDLSTEDILKFLY